MSDSFFHVRKCNHVTGLVYELRTCSGGLRSEPAHLEREELTPISTERAKPSFATFGELSGADHFRTRPKQHVRLLSCYSIRNILYTQSIGTNIQQYIFFLSIGTSQICCFFLC
jgi:hypothetical protein